MLVEINLLPQKQRRSSAIIKIVLLLSLILLLCSLFIGWQVQRYHSKIDGLQASITDSEQSIIALQQNNDASSTNSYVELSNAVEWSVNHPIKSVAVLQHLTSLLPERGFILSYAYSEAGTITLMVQFDTKKEAAYYLKWLDDSDWIKEVKLSQLSSSQTGDTTGQTNEPQTDTDAESFLPRYTGNFEITLNKEKVKEFQLKQNESEGGDNQ